MKCRRVSEEPEGRAITSPGDKQKSGIICCWWEDDISAIDARFTEKRNSSCHCDWRALLVLTQPEPDASALVAGVAEIKRNSLNCFKQYRTDHCLEEALTIGPTYSRWT
jgi:hypothetical protein